MFYKCINFNPVIHVNEFIKLIISMCCKSIILLSISLDLMYE